MDRWRRIALEASKQSRRSSIPEIAAPAPLALALAAEQSATRILLSEIEQSTPLWTALNRVPHSSRSEGWGQDQQQPPHPNQPDPDITHALAIGPEGGWTSEEMQLFVDHQWQPVTLGPRILRAETAAIAAIAVTSAYLD